MSVKLTFKPRSPNAVSVLLWTVVVSTLFSFAAWMTHVYVCIKEGDWSFLIAGAIAFPVAVVHGVGIWFGGW